MTHRYIPVDEEFPERDQATQDSLGGVRPLAELEEGRARWARRFDDLLAQTLNGLSTPASRPK